jgi:hypothetical protein
MGVKITFSEFKKLCEQDSFPVDLDLILLALWYDSKANWDKAHSIVQNIPGIDASWIHGYLHRKEGDEANATYWYSRAGKIKPSGSIGEEWVSISRTLLGK